MEPQAKELPEARRQAWNRPLLTDGPSEGTPSWPHFGLLTSRTGFPGSKVVKNLPANAGDARDTDSIAGLGRSPRGGHGNPLQYSCLENPHGQRSLAGYSSIDHKETRMYGLSTAQHSIRCIAKIFFYI